MYKCIHGWLACALAVVVTGGAAVAQGQQFNPSAGQDNSVAALQEPATMVSAKNADLETRVTELEKALADQQAKAAAAQAKADSAPTFNVGGIFQLDGAAFGGKDAATNSVFKPSTGNGFIDGAEFRRARLWAYGDAFNNVDYKMEFDFASTSRPKFKDVYVEVTQLPFLQNIRVGHFKEPFGLEELTSDRFITFMERSMLDEGLNIVPARNIGVEAYGWTENLRATYALGAFLNGDNTEDPPEFPDVAGQAALPTGDYCKNGDQTAMTGRLTWLPWYDEASEGRGLWHTSIAASYRGDQGIYDPTLGTTVLETYAVKPEAHLSPSILSFSNFPAIDNKLLGVENAFVYGPLSFQSEYYSDFVDGGHGRKEATFTGYYAYVSYFLTGENRVYNRQSGSFDRVRPFTNFFRVRTCDGVENGWGAWEVCYRWSHADFFDGVPVSERLVGMGRSTDNTVGLNWYLNPNTRIMFNYVFTDFDRINAGTTLTHRMTVDTFETRFAFDF